MDALKVKKTFLDILEDVFGMFLILAMGMATLFMGVYFA